jgi:hypothetical protein
MSRQDLIEQVVQTRLEQFSYDTTKDLMQWIDYVLRNGYESYNDYSEEELKEEIKTYDL